MNVTSTMYVIIDRVSREGKRKQSVWSPSVCPSVRFHSVSFESTDL